MPNYVPVSPSICLDGSRQQTPSQMSQFSNTSPNPRQLVRGHSARANRTSTAPTRCKGVMQGRDKKPPSYASFHYALPPSTEGPPTVGSSVGEKELIESIGQALPPSGLNPLELKSKQKQRAVPSFPQPHFDTISVESL
uniref:Uncharacterized protein n=1 Tax=Ditylenchus dipsaci TaxID=166011 RepID=A0A915CPD2_9BILA